jgi:tetratricopeptide (TPR) repeat protein
MITPAGRRLAFVSAKKKGKAAAPGNARLANAYELQLARLDADRRRLKQVQSIERKIKIKEEILPEYDAWISGVLAADRGGQDDIVVTVMVWRIDVGDYAGALNIAAYVLKHNLVLPDHYKRTPGCLVAEEIADAALRVFAAGDKFSLDVLTATLAVTRETDMPDEVRAKLIKAEGLALEADDDLERALASYQAALSLHDKVGVKKDIERVQRAIKNRAAGKPKAE